MTIFEPYNVFLTFNTNLYGSTSSKKHHLHTVDDQLWNAAFFTNWFSIEFPYLFVLRLLKENINGSKYIKGLIKIQYLIKNVKSVTHTKHFIIDQDGEMVVLERVSAKMSYIYYVQWAHISSGRRVWAHFILLCVYYDVQYPKNRLKKG